MVHSTAMVQDMWLSFTKAASALLDPLYATVSTNHLFQQPDSRQISTSCFYLSLTTWILIQKQSRVSSKCWSLLDHLLVTLTCIKVQFYSKGMGDEALYKTCVKRLKALVRGEDIVGLPKDLMLNEWSTLGDIRVCSGSFLSPIADLLPSQAAIQHAHMEIVCPKDSSFGSVLSEGTNPQYHIL